MMKKGFTLLETLITLGVLSLVLLLFVYQPRKDWQREISTRQFFDELSHALHYAQEVAIVSGYAVHVRFRATENVIQIIYPPEVTDSKMIILPENLDLRSNWQFYYDRHGRVNTFGRVTILESGTNKRYEVVFQLGSGKFDIR